MSEREECAFGIGEAVEKPDGYSFPGEVRGVFWTRAGKVRYVVEASHEAFAGMLHIFSGGQLRKRGEGEGAGR